MALLGFAVAGTTCTPFQDDTPAEAGATVITAFEAGPPCDFDEPFGAPTRVPGLDAIGATSVGGLRLSPDSLTAYFHASDLVHDVGYYDLYTASRDDPSSAFGMVTPMIGGEINTPDDEQDPTVTGDGLTLFFGRMSPATNPTYLYYATRPLTSVPFDNAALLPAPDGGGAMEATTPFVRADGHVLYLAFVSPASPATQTDIYRASWDGEALGGLAAVGEINTTFPEIYPVIAPDDLTIYFATTRDVQSMLPTYDIWAATRTKTTDPFAELTDLTEVNSAGSDFPTFVTGDGCTLYLSSDRSGSLAVYVAHKAGL